MEHIEPLWAKLGRGASTSAHPLICHLLDVAFVTRAMWNDVLSEATRSSVTEALKIPEQVTGTWVALLAGLHDLGKACPAFQNQDRDLTTRARIEEAGLPLASDYVSRDAPHGTVTACTLPTILTDEFQFPAPLAKQLAVAIGGHHGVLPGSDETQRLPGRAIGRGTWDAARLRLARELAAILDVDRSEVPQCIDNPTALTLAGLVSVADWIGSDERYFSHAIRDRTSGWSLELNAYCDVSRSQAGAALRELGWSCWSNSDVDRSFRSLFPFIEEANPLQEAAIALGEQLSNPGLVVIEAPMGEGKTEAALYLTEHWRARLGERGTYVALPTRATSDQMFTRMSGFLEQCYFGEPVNLQLLHGYAALSGEFRLLRRQADVLLRPREDDADVDLDSNVMAAEWFTHRKRGLLAPYGVGTIDQILLAVLSTRHVFVRLFGLNHKPVIIDEVHAYDTYMSVLLERLLEWLAALGAPVVLLSATLPVDRRRALIDAYRRGLGEGPVAAQDIQVPYPSLTWATTTQVGAVSAGTSSRSRKEVRLEWIDTSLPVTRETRFDLGECLQRELAEGGCAAIICNTVQRAQSMYQLLKPYFPGVAADGQPELGLLHARYPYDERMWRQEEVLTRFGKPDGKVTLDDGTVVEVERPQRAVVVATQIIEQSLDLDFDLMVSDLAPVDLLLQRAGRLHRHPRQDRPTRLEEPRLWVVAPDVTSDGTPRFDSGSAHIYEHHALLRTWLALRERTEVGAAHIRIPADVDDLIEAVYDSRSCPTELPAPLQHDWEESRTAHEAGVNSDRLEAAQRWLKQPGYRGSVWRVTGDTREEDAPELHQAHQALTRLAPPTVPVILLDQELVEGWAGAAIDGTQAPSLELVRRLLRRSVSISDRRVVWRLMDQAVPQCWARSALLRHHRLLILNAGGKALIGPHSLRLDPELGVVVENLENGG